MNLCKKISLILLWGISILFLCVPNNALSEPSVVMTPKQIYELMDNGQYDEAKIQATILKERQSDNPVAYLALGDAVAHYPNDDGDVYAAFDMWVQAKALSSPERLIMRPDPADSNSRMIRLPWIIFPLRRGPSAGIFLP